MTTDRRVILLEFNELSPELMERFIDEGHLPNFKRLRDSSQGFTTEAAERGWELNPWVQWVTVHSGLDYRDHGIIELDEGPKLKAKRVWDVVSEANLPVWICGSMNVAYERPLKGLVLPDPWTTKVQASDVLQPFFRFVQQNVLEHSTDRPSLGKADYAKFMTFMMSHGLSFRTVDAIVRQLVSERSDQGVRWKRAVLLDKLQFDVFRWFYRKMRPAFSTFFSNSTAHFQHYHWREMEPELFSNQPTPEKLAAHEGTILFGYQEMDKLIGGFLELAESDPGTVLVFSTAISQQACLVYEDQGGKMMYRPRDIAKLMQFANVTEAHTAAPLMAEVFNVHLKNEDEARCVEAKLNQLRVGDRPAMLVQRKENVLNAKCQLHERLSPETRIGLAAQTTTASFFDLFFELEDVKSGMHHPDGILWVRIPGRAPRVHAAKVPLSSVAPTLLSLLSLQAPRHMGAPIAPLAPSSRSDVPALVGSGSIQ
jgi:Type I phosphodiesterase / nucleotide pyrophosphatase